MSNITGCWKTLSESFDEQNERRVFDIVAISVHAEALEAFRIFFYQPDQDVTVKPLRLRPLNGLNRVISAFFFLNPDSAVGPRCVGEEQTFGNEANRFCL